MWEEAQLLGGLDPDFHRRDLDDAIEAGAFPEWELGIQVFPDTPEQTFEGIDLLDPTKLVPEELAPVQPIGRLTLTRNPTNFFAETEQVAFHTGHLVPGIDVTDDPLLQARLFSYLDTQLTRLGGPNFTQIPINRPHAPVNDMLRDGFHQTRCTAGSRRTGRTPSTAAARSSPAGRRRRLRRGAGHGRRAVEGARRHPASFDDHFSQARLFWLSMTPVEQEHIVAAYTFELGKCYEQAIKERQLQCLANIDADLCAAGRRRARPAGAGRRPCALVDRDAQPGAVPGRRRPGRSTAGSSGSSSTTTATSTASTRVREAVLAARAWCRCVIAPHGGSSSTATCRSSAPSPTGRSVEFDAVLRRRRARRPRPTRCRRATPRPARPGRAAAWTRGSLLLLEEACRHAKAIGAWGDGGIRP